MSTRTAEATLLELDMDARGCGSIACAAIGQPSLWLAAALESHLI